MSKLEGPVAATFTTENVLTGPTIFITGWRVGMNKVGVGRLLQQNGIGIGDAFRLVNQIIRNYGQNPEDENRFDDGLPIRVQVAEGIGRDEIIEQLRDLGVLID